MIELKLFIYYGSFLVFPFLFYIYRTRRKNKILKVILLFLALIFIYSRFIEPQIITVQKTQIDLGFKTKIALISDTHLGIYKGEGFLNRVVNKINTQNLDYVFIAGDLTGYPDKKNLNTLYAPLKKINTPVYWVLGNHDVEMPGENIREELIQALQQNNIHYLNNDEIIFENFTLLGLGSNWGGEDDVSILQKYTEQENIIVLTHNPDTTLKYQNNIADLTLAGHTHGGQIRIPWLYKKVIPTQGDFDKGLTKEEYTTLFTTSGLGETGLPMRLLNPPVIDILEIY